MELRPTKHGYIVECITIYTTPDIVTYTGVIYANEQDAVEECADALNDPDIIDAWVQKVRKNNARND